jgi:GDP-L-fucose synthase
MARAYMWCLANHSSAALLNVGCGQAQTIRSVAMMLAEICGVPAARICFDPARARGIDRRVTDNSAFRDRSGFAYTELREGLERTVAWYRRMLVESPGSIRRWPRIKAGPTGEEGDSGR